MSKTSNSEDAAAVEQQSVPDTDASAASDGFETAEAFRARVERWMEKAAADWSTALTVTATAAVKSIVEAGGADLAGAVAAAPLAVRATALAGETRVPLAILAGDAAALSVAKIIMGDAAQELDPEATTTYGDFARQILESLKRSWLADGLQRLSIEVGQPERLDAAPEDFGRQATLVSVVITAGADAIPLQFLFGGNLDDIFGPVAAVRAGQPAALSITDTRNMKRLLKIRVPLVVEIARRRVKLREVLALKPGTVLEFDKKSDDLLDLLVGQAPVGKGEAVKVGESFGMRVLDIGCVRDRIKSLIQ